MERRELLAEIMAAVRQDFKEILEAVEAAPAGRVLETVEFDVRRRSLVRYREILCGALSLSYESRERRPAARCSCGRGMRMAYRQEKTVTSVLGPMTFARRYYYCDECRESRVPFDETVGLDSGAYSQGARRLVSRAGSVHSFRDAQEELQELAELRISREAIRDLTEQVAQEVETAQKRGRFLGEEQRMEFRNGAGPTRAYVSADGTMVNTETGWHEVKAAAFYNQDKSEQHYVATLASADEFGVMGRAHADGVGVGRAAECVAIGDGAEWLWKMMGVQFPGSTEVVDYYHLSEHVWACSRSMYGEESAPGTRWAGARLSQVLEGGSGALLASLWGGVRRGRAAGRQEPLRSLLGYVERHRARLDYPTLRAAGIDIGSGPMESACKNVIGRRLKGGGMRWRLDHVESMARLRALTAGTGGWDAFWQAYRRPA